LIWQHGAHHTEVLMEAKTSGKADAWRQHIKTQLASGQSVRAWCRQNDCAEHAFYWWRARLGLSAGKRRPVKPLGFAQVIVNQPTAEPVRLRLAGSRELILPATMPLEQVAKLIRALEVVA
jgi:hypothetical protein